MASLRFIPSQLMRRLVQGAIRRMGLLLRLNHMKSSADTFHKTANTTIDDTTTNVTNATNVTTHGIPSEQHAHIIAGMTDKFANQTPQPHTPSSKQPTNQLNQSNITTQVKQLLDGNKWHYYYHPPKAEDNPNTHHLTLGMRNDGLEWGCLIRIQEDTQFVAMYGILPEQIPDTHRASAMLMMTQVNYGLMIGNVEMDLVDGEIRYKVAQDMEKVGVSEATVMPLFQSVIAMTHVVYRLVQDLLDEPNPSQDIDELLAQLQQQENSRRFFLPSEMMQ